ncbi:MAG: FRG domain-containing protein [Parasphingorhabdus sp.]
MAEKGRSFNHGRTNKVVVEVRKKKKRHFEKLPKYPDFGYVSEEVDGLVPACRIDGWEQFIEIMRRPEHNLAKGELVYRGQRGFDWHLSSTLSRIYESGSVPAEHQSELLGQFKLAMRGRGLDVSKLEEEEIWAFGQHHGLKTPLIDWTKSPYVALFFAFAEPDSTGEDNSSRAVYCLNMAAIRADDDMAGWIFEPSHYENARLVNQAGLFTLTPAGSDNIVSAIFNNLSENGVINPDDPIDVAKYVSKIHIPNENRIDCLNTLRKMNIHHANLFPDPGGAAHFCNDWLGRIIEAERADALEAEKAAEKELRKKIDPAQIAQQPGDVEEQIVTVLRGVLTGASLVRVATLRGWAPKIKALYANEATTDWPNHPSSNANLKVAFRRFFLSNGIDKEMAEICARRLIGFYREKWLQMKNS